MQNIDIFIGYYMESNNVEIFFLAILINWNDIFSGLTDIKASDKPVM